MDRPVGILGFQGCIAPHEAMFQRLGVETLRVTSPNHLEKIDRIILPGGESTTMLRLLHRADLVEPMTEFVRTHPTWGICAGAILLAREVVHPAQESLNAIDIRAHRNFYGSQLDSFTESVSIRLLGHRRAEVQFIRAPLLTALPASDGREAVEIEAAHDGRPVFFAQGHVWATSFHIELGSDTSLHERFLTLGRSTTSDRGSISA